MRKFAIPAALGLCLALVVPMAAAAQDAKAGPEPKTADAVRAADDAWGQAEMRGDAAFVDQLLLPDYRSVRPNGKADGKTAIIGGARKRANDPDSAKKTLDWRASHPERGDVVIVGDTAILTWVLTTPGAGEPVLSCDIFTYVDGHWRALYSQHTNAVS